MSSEDKLFDCLEEGICFQERQVLHERRKDTGQVDGSAAPGVCHEAATVLLLHEALRISRVCLACFEK